MVTEIITPKTKYLLITEQEYEAFNLLIGNIREYPNHGTERYAPDVPTKDVGGNCVLPITAPTQAQLKEALSVEGWTDIEGMMLESWEPKVEITEPEQFT